jgi:hypothetical protein
MMVKALGCFVAAVCLLTCAAGMAQTRATPARYYTATYGSPTGAYSYAGYHHGGCADCGVPGPACGCDYGCGGPGRCHGCHRCCPRIIPALARGVGAVADFVGCTLDVIFCHPGGGCGGCGPRGCCLRRPACGTCCGGGSDCCDGGFDGYGGEVIHGEPMEAVPAGPPMPAQARVYRPHTTTRAIVSPKAAGAYRTSSTKRPAYATSQASAQVELSKSAGAPRELQVDEANAVALNPFGDEVVVAPAQVPAAPKSTVRSASPTTTKPVAAKTPSRTAPANPLRK